MHFSEGFLKWGYPQMDGFCHGKSHWNGRFGGTSILGSCNTCVAVGQGSDWWCPEERMKCKPDVLWIGVEGIQCSHSPLPGGLQAYPHDFLAEGFFRDQCFVTTASRREQKCYIDYMVRWDGLVRCLDLFWEFSVSGFTSDRAPFPARSTWHWVYTKSTTSKNKICIYIYI